MDHDSVYRQSYPPLCRLMTQKTCLQEVDLGHNNLAGVNEDILASGVNLVHVVKLYDTNLTRY